jgi:hypothetical protein
MVENSAPRPLDLAPLEAELAAAIAHGQEQPRELLERLVDELLAGCGGLSSLNTDGLVISQEFRAADGYLVLGHVWMLPDGVTEPVMVRIAFPQGKVTATAGEVSFGLSPDRPTSPSVSHRKSLKLLLADANQARHRIPWAYRFRRDADGWVRADPVDG